MLIQSSKKDIFQVNQLRNSAEIFCAVMVVTSQLAGGALAGAPSPFDSMLVDLISQTQNLMTSISQGCPGGPSGLPPVNWGELKGAGDQVVNQLYDVRLALVSAESEVPHAMQQIRTIRISLDAIVSRIHNSCAGGANGVDPIPFNQYSHTIDFMKSQLDLLQTRLEDGPLDVDQRNPYSRTIEDIKGVWGNK
jgi:hypothetical protein